MQKIEKRDGSATGLKIKSPGELWYDETGALINAHGGGIIFHGKRYYWFGEKRGVSASEGINVYSSEDLYNWRPEGIALAPDSLDTLSDIAVGCLMERPKVIYNAKTKKFVLWFHLERRGQGYNSARAGVAVSDTITGPYKFVQSARPNGNMSRDLTAFVDDDGNAYLIYASRDNADLRIARLNDDFLSVSASDTLLFSGFREAPAIFKSNEQYYLFTSGSTGWSPNPTTLHRAKNLWGPWHRSWKNPLKGPDARQSFYGQPTFIFSLEGLSNQFIFMADRWNPQNLQDSRYLWLPINFKEDLPFVEWKENFKH